MRGLLLGTQALQSFVAADPTLTDWLEAQGDTPLHTTFASIAVLLAMAEQLTDVGQRRLWIESLTETIPVSFGPRLHGFELEMAKRFSAVRADLPADTVLAETDLFVISAALANELDYVAPHEPRHDKVSGLTLLDPWQ